MILNIVILNMRNLNWKIHEWGCSEKNMCSLPLTWRKKEETNWLNSDHFVSVTLERVDHLTKLVSNVKCSHVYSNFHEVNSAQNCRDEYLTSESVR